MHSVPPVRPTARPHRLLAMIAILAVAAGAAGCGGGSTASTTTQSPGTSDVHTETIGAIAAAYLGITRAQLHAQLARGRTLAQIAESTSGHSAKGLGEAILKSRLKRLEAEVKKGTISQAQLATRMATERRHVELRLERADAVAISVVAATAIRYLGVSEGRLRAERAKGRSLAQIASSSPGHSASGLLDAIVAAEEAQLRKAGHAKGVGAPSLRELRRRVSVIVYHKPVGGSAKAGKHAGKGSGEAAGGESASGQASSEGG